MAGARNNAVFIQQGTGPHGALLDLTRRRHQSYALQHRMDFWRITEPQQNERVRVWDKILLILKALHAQANYQWVFWIDADALIARPSVDLRRALRSGSELGMVIHPNPYHFNAGALYLRNTPAAKAFFEAAWGLWPVDHPWEEQTAMNRLLARSRWEGFQPLPATWNSTWGVNEVAGANVRAWHGVTHQEQRLRLMTAALEESEREPAMPGARRGGPADRRR